MHVTRLMTTRRWSGPVFVAVAGIVASAPAPALAHPQMLIPIVRDVSTSTSSTPVWNAFVQVMTENHVTYVSLAQAAVLFDGTLRWYPVSKRVDLAEHGHTIAFFYNSTRVLLDGIPSRLKQATQKSNDGFWVPASFFATQRFSSLSGQRLNWPPPVPKPVAVAKVAPPPVVAPARVATPAATPAPAPVAATTPEPVAVPEPASTRAIHRIVIDPGHGGKDPGALSVHGIEEKTLNLLMAQALADALRDRFGYEVLLTRTDDTFIPLEQRAQLANHYNADLFISIHCNASLSPKLRGFEVYFLSEHASDPHAAAVAKLENAPLALEGNGSPSPGQLDALLRSLVKNANINESSALGSLIDRQVDQRLSEPSLGVQQAAFYVLRGAEMPAVLIETGFLTNKKEEKLLQDASFRKDLIDAIAQGVDAYDQRKQKERR